MPQDEISLESLRGVDVVDPIAPLLNEVSSNLDRNHTNFWNRPITWIQKSRSVFKRRAKTIHEQNIPLISEDLVAPLDVLPVDNGPRFASLEYLGSWFPEAYPSHPKAHTFRAWRSKRRTVLRGCLIVAILIFLINVSVTVYFKTKWKTTGDVGAIYRGDCSQSHRLSSYLHIVINVLSTTLLGASNLCMQLLAAPTRREIDEAHENYVWLDIGVPSFRNLKYISKRRSTAVYLLAISSIPLHFLYNSVIIPTVAINTFAYIVVNPSFLEGSSWNTTETRQAQLSPKSSSNNITWMLQTWHGLDLQSTVRSMQVNARNSTLYTRIDSLDCILTYNDLMGNRSDFIMVSATAPISDNSLLAYGMSMAQTWDIGYSLCGQQFDCGRMASLPLTEQRKIIQDWNIGGYKIDFCLCSQRPTENLCSVEYPFSIMLIVCIFNLFKCVLICYTALYHSSPEDRPLSSVGDAICSFLQDPDKSTRGLGIVSKQQISKHNSMWRAPVARKYLYEQPRWLHAVSWRRWALCIGLCFATLLAGCVFLGRGIAGLKDRKQPTDFGSLVNMGFGAVHAKSLIFFIGTNASASSLYQSVGFSNVWQFAISLLYLAYNAVLTAMLVANEWDKFGEIRKPLRVTEPQGLQRSTYAVSVPLKYGLPIIVAFGALHYTISQSVFVVYMTRFFSNGTEDVANRTAKPGYSCIAIITSMILGCALLLLLTLTGLFARYRRGTPLASTCSAAISAACQRPARDTQAHMFQVQWGVVSVNPKTNIGHCAFTTAKDVTGDKSRPESGHLYV